MNLHQLVPNCGSEWTHCCCHISKTIYHSEEGYLDMFVDHVYITSISFYIISAREDGDELGVSF